MVIVSAVVPELVKVTVSDLLVTMFTEPKLKSGTDGVTPGAPAVAAPVNGIESVPPAILPALV